jgi:hypothetical protein
MPELKAARRELQRACESRDALAKTAHLVELDERWRETLRCIERTWNKLQAEMRQNSKWQGWPPRGEFISTRRDDPLLKYLTNARGADEHGIAALTELKPGHLSINPAEGTELNIGKLIIENGTITELKSPQPLRLEIEPGKAVLAAVVNRGTNYPVPTEHLGLLLPASDPVTIASAGIKYYAEVIRRIDSEFHQ